MGKRRETLGGVSPPPRALPASPGAVSCWLQPTPHPFTPWLPPPAPRSSFLHQCQFSVSDLYYGYYYDFTCTELRGAPGGLSR